MLLRLLLLRLILLLIIHILIIILCCGDTQLYTHLSPDGPVGSTDLPGGAKGNPKTGGVLGLPSRPFLISSILGSILLTIIFRLRMLLPPPPPPHPPPTPPPPPLGRSGCAWLGPAESGWVWLGLAGSGWIWLGLAAPQVA